MVPCGWFCLRAKRRISCRSDSRRAAFADLSLPRLGSRSRFCRSIWSHENEHTGSACSHQPVDGSPCRRVSVGNPQRGRSGSQSDRSARSRMHDDGGDAAARRLSAKQCRRSRSLIQCLAAYARCLRPVLRWSSSSEQVVGRLESVRGDRENPTLTRCVEDRGGPTPRARHGAPDRFGHGRSVCPRNCRSNPVDPARSQPHQEGGKKRRRRSLKTAAPRIRRTHGFQTGMVTGCRNVADLSTTRKSPKPGKVCRRIGPARDLRRLRRHALTGKLPCVTRYS